MPDYTAKKISDLEGFYKGLFLRARDEVGASSFGLGVIELGPNADDDHPGGQEEVYVVLRGSGEMDIGQAYEAPDYSTVGAADPLA